MSQFIQLTAPTKNPVHIRRDQIVSVYSEHYNTMPATFIRLGFGTGQYVLESREWVIQSLEHPDKPNNHERWLKPKEVITPPKSAPPTQESARGPKSPPKAAKAKTPPKPLPQKKGPPKRK